MTGPLQLIATVSLVVLAAAPAMAESKDAFPYQSCFEIASRMHGVPVDLLLAVAAIESAWDPDARSNKDAHGIMQIQWPGTAKHLGVRRVAELYNPCLNIELGARYLRELVDASGGDVERALAAYNYGPGRIARSRTLPEGAAGYARKVATRQEAINASARAQETTLTSASGVTFDSRRRAERFARTLEEQITGASFITTRTANGAYDVNMVVRESGLSATDVVTLKTLGWSELGAGK